jgi:hypothetical protein
MNQSTSNILMIRPVNFGFNEQTAGSNAFQNRDDNNREVQQKALKEFDGFVATLRQNNVDIIVAEDTIRPYTPDSIFPNNWVSFHADGNIILYPMQAENRRQERREDIITQLKDNFKVKKVEDLSHFEAEGKYLEGTGSMVLDRQNKIVYACLSPRTNAEVLAEFCKQTGYSSITFDAFDQNNTAIYHTNVLMGVGSGFAVVCLDSIANEQEKNKVIASFKATKKEIIVISFDQMKRFAGNLLEVKNTKDETLIVMSQSAYYAFNEQQKAILSKYGKLVYADISTIENIGGGSARCMMAEVHLPVS